MRGKALVLAFVAFVACTQQSGDNENATLRFQVSGEAEEVSVYRALIKAFERANPDVRVKMTAIADKDDHLAKLATSFSAGDPPDVFLVNFREYSQFVTRGALEPVEEQLTERGFDPADYYEQPLGAFTYDDTLQCMPQNISSLVVYYNKDLLEQAGLDRPPDRWTWEDFRDYGVKMTTGDVDGIGIEPSVIRVAPFVWGNGGEIVDDPDQPSRFVLNEPAAREAVEFIVSLVRDDLVVPTEEEITAQDLETRFATGKVAMLLSSRRDTPVFREVFGLNWDVAPLPVGNEPAGILHSDGYCIAAGSSELAPAFDFVRFATGEEGQTITALAGRTVPSLRSVARSGAFLDPTQPPAHSEVFLDGVPFIRRTPVIPTWPEIEAISEEIFTRMFYEPGYSIDKGLQELDRQTRPLFEEAQSG